jgi:hypothetical protein
MTSNKPTYTDDLTLREIVAVIMTAAVAAGSASNSSPHFRIDDADVVSMGIKITDRLLRHRPKGSDQ